MLLVPEPLMPKHELVLLRTRKMTVTVAIQESGLVQEGIPMTPARVETRPTIAQMVIGRSRRWATFLFSDSFF